MEKKLKFIDETIKLLYKNEEHKAYGQVLEIIQEEQKDLQWLLDHARPQQVIVNKINFLKSLLKSYKNTDFIGMADCLLEYQMQNKN